MKRKKSLSSPTFAIAQLWAEINVTNDTENKVWNIFKHICYWPLWLIFIKNNCLHFKDYLKPYTQLILVILAFITLLDERIKISVTFKKKAKVFRAGAINSTSSHSTDEELSSGLANRNPIYKALLIWVPFKRHRIGNPSDLQTNSCSPRAELF